MNHLTVLIPVPHCDFDPTEVAVSWKILCGAGHAVDFATPDGNRAHADPKMISGVGLDPWGWIPGLNQLRLAGLMLRADRFGRGAYRELERDARFLHPKRYDELRVDDYAALLLPGGHAQGMKPYLESHCLQSFVAEFFDSQDANKRHRPVAAICHGVLLAARSVSKQTQKSVLYGRKTTALPWTLERNAWLLSRFLVRYWDPDYYRTYRESGNEAAGHWSVEQEIKRALADDRDFLDVPADTRHHFLKTCGLVRDRAGDSRPAWVVRDDNYVSARWPGDAHTFAQQFVALIAEHYGAR